MFASKALILKQNHKPLGKARLFGCAWIAAGLCLAALPAEAARGPDAPVSKASKEKVTAVAAKEPETTSSIQDDGLNCAQSRKRLWVQGEGWIVRRVTTCY